MLTASLLIAFLALAQIPFYGDIPETVPTFKMTFPNGDVAYGALWVDDAWYTDTNVTVTPGKQPTIVYDTPWNPMRDRVLRQPEYVVETLALRKQRLAEEWKTQGYAPVQTRDGERYVLAEEAELAARAQQMEDALLAPPAPVELPVESASEPPAEPGLFERWGLHALVLFIGLGITALVFRRMVLS